MVNSVSIFFFFFFFFLWSLSSLVWSGKGVTGPPSNFTTWGPAPKAPRGDLVWTLLGKFGAIFGRQITFTVPLEHWSHLVK